jgi:RNA polymerase sigma factor (sigma-70 family)
LSRDKNKPPSKKCNPEIIHGRQKTKFSALKAGFFHCMVRGESRSAVWTFLDLSSNNPKALRKLRFATRKILEKYFPDDSFKVRVRDGKLISRETGELPEELLMACLKSYMGKEDIVRKYVGALGKIPLRVKGRYRHALSKRKEERKGNAAYRERQILDGMETTQKPELQEALKSLSPKQREVIELVVIKQLTQAQAARELGISRKNVKKRYDGAIAKLKLFFAI